MIYGNIYGKPAIRSNTMTIKCYNHSIPKQVFNSWLECFKQTDGRFLYNPREYSGKVVVSYEIDDVNQANALNEHENRLRSNIIEKKRPVWRKLIARYLGT